jgi:hypothetical protein
MKVTEAGSRNWPDRASLRSWLTRGFDPVEMARAVIKAAEETLFLKRAPA